MFLVEKRDYEGLPEKKVFSALLISTSTYATYNKYVRK